MTKLVDGATLWRPILLILCCLAVPLRHVHGFKPARALADLLRSSVPAPIRLARRPRISALVAAWNKNEDLHALVRTFLGTDYPNKEVVVAVGGSALFNMPLSKPSFITLLRVMSAGGLVGRVP